MDYKPWYQKRKLEPAFPFLFKDNTFHGYAFHWHELLEFVYIVQGSINIVLEGKAYNAVRGDMVFISPDVIHGFFGGSPDVITATYQVGMEFFDRDLFDLREAFSPKLIFSRKPFISPLDDGGFYRRIEDLLLAIRQEFYDKKKGFRMAIRTRIYELALIFLREIPGQKVSPNELARRKYNHQILERVLAFIHGNFTDPGITLEHAAGAAALSKYYFTRYFKQQTGQTFHAYLSRLRVSHAEECLTESDLPITEIAYQCGFASLKTFNRIFKALTGVSPSGYRWGPGRLARRVEARL